MRDNMFPTATLNYTLLVGEPMTLTLPQKAPVARVTFESPDHLDVWLEDGSHLIVYAPIGGHIHMEYRPCPPNPKPKPI